MDSEIELEPYKKTQLCHRPGTLDGYVIGERMQYVRGLNPQPDDVLLDVGANIGAVSAEFAARCKGVIALEPEPDNVRVLRRNVMNYSNVLVLPAAATLTGGKREFWLNTGVNKGMHSLVARRGRVNIEVDSYPLETLVLAYQPTLLKIDIEGGEYELMPTLELLSSTSSWKGIRGIAMELHLTHGTWRAKEAPEMVALLERHSFTMTHPVRITAKNWATLGVWHRSVSAVPLHAV